MTFKNKFVHAPQHDSEGFTVMDAKCRGCEPADMCPRSGHCDRYMSPLREAHGIPAWMVSDLNDRLAVAKSAFAEHTAEMADAKRLVDEADARQPSETDVLYRELTGRNTKGWDEVDGVNLPPVSVWAQLPDELIEAGFQAWLRLSSAPQRRRILAKAAECPQTERCAHEHEIECACAALGSE